MSERDWADEIADELCRPHSDRQRHGENNAIVAQRFRAALRQARINTLEESAKVCDVAKELFDKQAREARSSHHYDVMDMSRIRVAAHESDAATIRALIEKENGK